MSNNQKDSIGRPPPLRAVQVFAAAAAHESFTQTAHTLSITPGAVSRQVRELEDDLGVALFERRGRTVYLTDAGRHFAAVCQSVISKLTHEAAELRSGDSPPVVTISMLPSVAARWLAPRLGAFTESHPALDLRIAASRHFTDFAREGVDAGIRYGRGVWPGVTAHPLGDEELFPVCSPGYAESLNLCRPEDLARASMLRGDLTETWWDWLRLAGIEDRAPQRGLAFKDDAALLKAAEDGLGVALGRSLLVADALRSGHLVAPFGQRIRSSFSYYFVIPVQTSMSPALLAVQKWLSRAFTRTFMEVAAM